MSRIHSPYPMMIVSAISNTSIAIYNTSIPALVPECRDSVLTRARRWLHPLPEFGDFWR